jgi:hypothetical protein
MNVVKSRLIPALVALGLAMVVATVQVRAQEWRIAWSPARNISNSPTSSNRPTMVADAAGNVHVIWAEDMGGESVLGIPDQLTVEANTLVYTRWDGSEWSAPIDVIALPNDNVAEYPSMAIDSQQVLHLVWTGVGTIYYSRVAAQDAGTTRAWLPPVPVGDSARTAWESDIAVDAQDVPHIIYATRGEDPAVYYTRITNQGLGVETPVRLSPGLERPDEVALLHLSLTIDPQGRMHALWSTVRTEGFGHAIYYARSVDGGQTWSKAVRLAQGEKSTANTEFPSLGIVGDSELHLIYTYPANVGRYERISLDGGETWGEPHPIYLDLEGIAGFNVQVNDDAGNLHVLSNMRTRGQVGGLLYWRWLDGNWSPWQWANIETETTGPGGHFTAATVRLGNEIHALWNTNLSNQAGEIWHVSGMIPGVPARTPVPLPSSDPVDLQSADGESPQIASTADLDQPAVVDSSTSAEPLPALDDDRAPAASPVVGSLAGIIPALFVVLGAVAWHLWRRR